jgi:DNA-binding response OmpR family regulator
LEIGNLFYQIANLIATEGLTLKVDIDRIATGATALDEIRGRRPTVVLLDIMLPDVSGYDICANVRKDHSLEAVKIIMITARGSSHQRSKCIGLGANEFIEKPFYLTALRQELKRQIEPV